MTDRDTAKRNLAQVIVDDYLRGIATGDLQPGHKLPIETEMCDAYGMSRSAVREALHKLAGKGFITVRQGSGSVIAGREQWNELDPEFLRQSVGTDLMRELVEVHLIEAREMLEPVMARLAAVRATKADRRRLRELLDEQFAIGPGDPSRQADVDMEFHSTLARATHNPLMNAMHSSMVTIGRQSRHLAARNPGGVERALSWHSLLLDAVDAGDPNAAGDAMSMHMRQVRAEFAAMARQTRDEAKTQNEPKRGRSQAVANRKKAK